jgi:hypothetical protein
MHQLLLAADSLDDVSDTEVEQPVSEDYDTPLESPTELWETILSDFTLAENLVEGVRADSTTDSVTVNAIQVFDASDEPIEDVTVQNNVVRDVVNGGDSSTYGGAAAIKVQGTVDDVDVVGNNVTDVYSAGWVWGIVMTHTKTADYADVSPKNVTVEENTVAQLNTGGPQFDPLVNPTSARYPGVAFGVDGNSDASEVTVSRNNFVSVPVGAQTKDPGHVLDVRDNWWGDATGPSTLAGGTVQDTETDELADGAGSAVSVVNGGVRFDPWLNADV